MTAYPRINVGAFGAKGDGVTDDSTAILAAVNAAFGMGKLMVPGQSVFSFLPPIFFPSANYLIEKAQCFNPTAIPPGCSIQGLSFIGESYGGTQITFNSNGVGWLFNNQDVASQIGFKNLQFIGKTGKESGLRFACTNNAGRVFSSCFEDCDFSNFAQALRFDGSFNTSENKFHRVGFGLQASQVGITIDNEQAVNFWLDDIGATGAGTIINLIQGGCVHVRNLAAELQGGVFFTTQPPNAGIGVNNDGIYFNGGRAELYGNAQFAVIQNGMHCTIRDFNFNPVVPAAGTNHLVATAGGGAYGSTIRVMDTISSGNLAASADSTSSITFDANCNPIAGAKQAA